MAVPTIVSVSPQRGHTGGLGLVLVTGSGFRTWAIPAPAGAPTGPVWPTVEVLFGSRPGREVMVVSPERLYVRPPASPLPAESPGYGEGLVAVTVRNLNADGTLVSGDTATLAGAYRYERPQLANESDLGRLVRELVRLFRTQVLANVSISTHADWDRDVVDLGNLVDVASLPAIVLFGPRIIENRFYTQHGLVTTQLGTEFELRTAPDADDLSFGFVGVSDQKLEAINLQAAVRKVFVKNRWLVIVRDPAHPELGTVSYDIVLDPAGIGFDPPADQKSNLRSFSGSFVVRGFEHEDLTGFAGDDVVAHGAQVTQSPSVMVIGKDE